MMIRLAVVMVGVLLVAGFAFAQDAAAPRDPMLMGVASFVVPGLGQFLQGDVNKAVTHFVVAVAISTAGFYLAWITPAPVYPLVGLATLGWAFYSAMDSYQMAVQYNQEHGFSLGIEYQFSLGGAAG